MIDLYAIGFRAAMSTDEHRAYSDDHPPTDEIAARHAALVGAARHLVFVYPTWWSGLPAILKGWLERVLVTGVAFGLDETTRRVVPRLDHIERITGISTYGSPWLYVRLINDNGRRIITRALRLVCGRRTRTSWLALYAIDTSTPDERERFRAEVGRRLAAMRWRDV